MPKKNMNCCDQTGRVWYVSKMTQDNDVIDHTIVVYVENDIELS